MTMRRLPVLTLALAMFALGGCATTEPYGNFVASSTAVDQTPLAREVVRQLASLWPPARTRLVLQHATNDAFGAALVGHLRSAGYAVVEYGSARGVGDDSNAPDQAAVASYGAEGARGRMEAGTEGMSTPAVLSLRYVLDHDAGTDLYRLTLWMGTQSLTRAYQMQNGSLVAAGYWVRKE